MSSYRPNYGNRYDPLHLPPPPPPPLSPSLPPPPPPYYDMRPLPPPPPPPFDPYRGGDSYRPPQSDFSYRHSDSAPRFPREQNLSRSRNPSGFDRQQNGRTRGKTRHDDKLNLNRARGGIRQRPRQNQRAAPADRPLLHHLDESNTTEQMPGMRGGRKFLAAEDLSDSEEESMDDSASEVDQDATDVADPPTQRPDNDSANDPLEPPSKRRALNSDHKNSQDTVNEPKWSNPDPYTVLPPNDDGSRKRKDVVKLIRKARMAAEETATEQNQVTANDDFISFGMENAEESEEEASISTIKQNGVGRGMPNAPTGPRQFSHLNNLHGQRGVEPSAASTHIASPDDMESSHQLAQTIRKALKEPSEDGTPLDIVEKREHGRGRPYAPRSPLESHYLDDSNGSFYQTAPNASEELVVDTGQFDSQNTLSYGSDANLGSRKRTHDDAIKGSRKNQAHNHGSILYEWRPLQGMDPVPWLKRTDLITANAGFRLHKEICDFYDFVRPKDFEQVIRQDLLSRLQTVVGSQLPNTTVLCFGSFAAGLYLPTADMDVVIVSNSFRSSGQRIICQNKNQMWRFAKFLENSGVTANNCEVIHSAKVPIIKFVDRLTGIKIDISFENSTGIIANETFTNWKSQYPAMPILVTLIKQFLMMRGLNEVQHGGLGGFSVTCLVTSLLQNMPRVQSGDVIPEDHLGEMLLEFLDFYGNRLDVVRTGIVMDPPGYFDKSFSQLNIRGPTYSANNPGRLAIMDPNRPSNDISGGSREVMLIFDRFAQAHEEILRAMKSPGRVSLLDWLLAGNYESFFSQRSHLLRLYREKWGSPEDLAQGQFSQVYDQDMKVATSAQDSAIPSVSGKAFVASQNQFAGSHDQDLDFANNTHEDFAPMISEGALLAAQRPEERYRGGRVKKRADGVARAAKLRANYPDMKNIPEHVSEKLMASLIKGYETKKMRMAAKAAKLAQDRFSEAHDQSMGFSNTGDKAGVAAQGQDKGTQKAIKKKRTPGEERAAELQAKYPGMKEIHGSVTPQRMAKLIKSYEKWQMKEAAEAGQTQEQESSKPSRTAKRKAKERNRAQALKNQYPDMTGIPNMLSKKGRRKFIAAHEDKKATNPEAIAAHGNERGIVEDAPMQRKSERLAALPQRPLPSPPPQQTFYQTRQYSTALTSVQNPPQPALESFRRLPASNKMAPLTDERRAEVARNLSSGTNDDPIAID
ncbi:hypothetical protein ACLMJK_004626 [Lecanora helva]